MAQADAEHRSGIACPPCLQVVLMQRPAEAAEKGLIDRAAPGHQRPGVLTEHPLRIAGLPRGEGTPCASCRARVGDAITGELFTSKKGGVPPPPAHGSPADRDAASAANRGPPAEPRTAMGQEYARGGSSRGRSFMTTTIHSHRAWTDQGGLGRVVDGHNASWSTVDCGATPSSQSVPTR